MVKLGFLKGELIEMASLDMSVEELIRVVRAQESMDIGSLLPASVFSPVGKALNKFMDVSLNFEVHYFEDYEAEVPVVFYGWGGWYFLMPVSSESGYLGFSGFSGISNDQRISKIPNTQRISNDPRFSGNPGISNTQRYYFPIEDYKTGDEIYLDLVAKFENWTVIKDGEDFEDLKALLLMSHENGKFIEGSIIVRDFDEIEEYYFNAEELDFFQVKKGSVVKVIHGSGGSLKVTIFKG